MMGVTNTGPAEPPLLRTCKRIRDESIGMYYNRNAFYFIIQDCDGLSAVSFKRQLARYNRLLADNLYICANGGYEWSDLKAWLKEIHAGRSETVDFTGEDRTIEIVIEEAFVVLSRLMHLTWDNAELFLEVFHAGVKSAEEYRTADENL